MTGLICPICTKKVDGLNDYTAGPFTEQKVGYQWAHAACDRPCKATIEAYGARTVRCKHHEGHGGLHEGKDAGYEALSWAGDFGTMTLPDDPVKAKGRSEAAVKVFGA